MDRCINQEVFGKAEHMIKRFQKNTLSTTDN